MPFRKTWKNRVTTRLPSALDPANVVAILHDHGFLITLSPIVTRYEMASTEPDPTNPIAAGDKINYDVWEKINVLPGGVAKKEITFKCSFENTQHGVVSWIQAPMGLTSRAEYVVRFVGGGDVTRDGAGHSEREEGWVLDERIESSCSVFLKSFVEHTMVKTRKEMHGRIVTKADESKA